MENIILFDLTACQPSPDAEFHGGSEYAKFIFHEALLMGKNNFDCIYNPSLKLDSVIESICKERGIKLYEVHDLSDISEVIRINEYKVFYSAMPYSYGKIELGFCKFIFTIHGLRDLECPSDTMMYKYFDSSISKLKLLIKRIFLNKRIREKNLSDFRELLKIRNKIVITDSEHSRYSILSFFPEEIEADIKVIHAPIKLLERSFQSQLESDYINIKKKYFLLVSGNRWIKNNYRAILALDQLFSEGLLKDKKVIILGVKDNITLKKVNNPDRFIFLDYLKEDEFSWFFENAFGFVYPTLNEGFGYPPLNAMNLGVPTIGSAVSSVPEICLDAVLYFNPYSVDEIKNRILQINEDSQLYKKLVKKGKVRLEDLMKKQIHMKEELIDVIFGK